ncbi:hypothetical protein [Pseudomonas fitomaticsae]|uniref:Uncharacterized protein n=1 Tax=Pseudomonas fitomaticsae TaxID=2837969 RepID=A0ABY3PW99_9PSED|nr:hypothetical protein [Pseudomonas fitomaticsae]UFP97922.1 hypothetical protein KJY40_17860 [Pseudomonas fitomaticsae]
MTTFSDLCTAELSKAQHDSNHVGGVCRVNQNDSYLVTFHNNGYDTAASPPTMGETVLQLDPAPRIPSVRATLKKEVEDTYEHPAKREHRYWETMVEIAESGRMSYEHEALILHRERLRYGLDNYEGAVKKIKEQQLANVKGKRAIAAQEMEKRYDPVAHSKMTSGIAEEQYIALQKRSLTYPHEYASPRVENTAGGHAEENFIRAWSALCMHIPEKITNIELYITRMPCPDVSSGFWLGAHLYNEGCMGKLAKLITTADEAIRWQITYSQTLNGADQAFSQSLSRHFPEDRVTFLVHGA